MISENFVILGIVIAFLGDITYIIDTIKGKIKPNKVSFFLWSFAALTTFAAQVSEGVGLTAIMTLSVGLTPLVILIASFLNKKAYWKITTFDLVCGALSILGLLLWYITKNGNLAIFFGILSDGLASLPTMIKAYKFPETENWWSWLADSIKSILTLLAIKTWTFASIGFPLYYFLVVATVFIFVKFKLGKHLG